MAIADLEVYDDDGTATIQASTLFGRVLGTFNTGLANGSRYMAGIRPGRSAYYAAPQNVPFIASVPVFSLGTDVISWYFPEVYLPSGTEAPKANCTVIVVTP